jgi:hypothetical protein
MDVTTKLTSTYWGTLDSHRWTGATFTDFAMADFGRRLEEVLTLLQRVPSLISASLYPSPSHFFASCVCDACTRHPRTHVCLSPCVSLSASLSRQILRIRVTHEELLSLLRPEEMVQLRVGDAFKPFARVNVRVCGGLWLAL